ncbi:AtpZ/AtpI family protein [Paraburkholderia mimosarum]|uniref:AtpZ/AtpI family protein n=1 Tax=Paraburkholderia mimosarum TaxID=312026 RepID=UPI0003FB3FC4|nr:AtpZ/AtpI family protein [Paraburkholderia mimosarum]
MSDPSRESNHMARAARDAAQREARGRAQPEPSLGSRLGQMGILGWTIVLPTLAGLAIGHMLDRLFGTRVFFSAPMLMLGAAAGLWFAWKWMRRQERSHEDD